MPAAIGWLPMTTMHIYIIQLVRFSFPFPFLFPSTYAEVSNVHCDRNTSPEARLPRDEAMSDTPPSPAATDAATASSDGPSLLERCTAEAIGTSMIIGGGCGSVCAARFVPGYALGPLGVSMAFGASVALAVYMTRDVSGAHLNPAITAALAVHRPDAVSPYEAACYMGAQLTGATLAAVRDCMLSARVVGTLLRRSLWLIDICVLCSSSFVPCASASASAFASSASPSACASAPPSHVSLARAGRQLFSVRQRHRCVRGRERHRPGRSEQLGELHRGIRHGPEQSTRRRAGLRAGGSCDDRGKWCHCIEMLRGDNNNDGLCDGEDEDDCDDCSDDDDDGDRTADASSTNCTHLHLVLLQLSPQSTCFMSTAGPRVYCPRCDGRDEQRAEGRCAGPHRHHRGSAGGAVWTCHGMRHESRSGPR